MNTTIGGTPRSEIVDPETNESDCETIYIHNESDGTSVPRDKCNAGNDYLHVGYPSSYAPKLTPKTQATIDMCAYGALLYFTIIRLFLKRATKTAKLRCFVISMMLCYLITANIMTILTDYSRDIPQ